jgi:hypothetical protein
MGNNYRSDASVVVMYIFSPSTMSGRGQGLMGAKPIRGATTAVIAWVFEFEFFFIFLGGRLTEG